MREHALPTLSDTQAQAKLITFDAGRRAFEHAHDGAEITLVLRGAYADHTGRYARGDVQFICGDTHHQPQVDDGEDCVCFSVNMGGVRVVNPIRQFIRYMLQ